MDREEEDDFKAHAALWDWLAWLAQEMREEAELLMDCAQSIDCGR